MNSTDGWPGVSVRRDRRQAIWDDLTRPARSIVPTSRSRVVTVFSAKGGSGKTTIATNIAAALADAGRRDVCLLDLDLAFGDVAIALQLFPVHTIADALPLRNGLDASAVRSLVTAHSPGLSALVSPIVPGQAEAISVGLVSTVIRLLRQDFEYVVVDTPPAFDDHVLTTFELSDVVVLVATPDAPGRQTLRLTLETMDLIGLARGRRYLVLNRVGDTEIATPDDRTYGLAVSARVPRSRQVSLSINSGLPLVLDAPAHAVSRALTDFAQMLVDVTSPSETSAFRDSGPVDRIPVWMFRERLTAHAETAAATRGLIAHVMAPEPTAQVDATPGLLQLCFEALATASSHVDAHHLWVDLRIGAQIVFRVEDDGIGPVSYGPGSRRMRRLAEMAARVGAYLAVDCRPGRGTAIEITAV